MSPILFLLAFLFATSLVLVIIGLLVNKTKPDDTHPRFTPYTQVLTTFTYEQEKNKATKL